MKRFFCLAALIFTLGISSVGTAQQLSLSQRRQLFTDGVRLYEDKRYSEARIAFEQLVDRYPELQDYVLFFLGHTYIKLKEEQKALQVFQEFLTHYASHPLKYDVQLNTAHLLRANEDYMAARDLYRQLLGHPDIEPGEVYYRLGQTFLGLNKPREAVFSFHQMVSFSPEHPARKQAQQQLQALIQKDPSLQPQWTEGTLLKHAHAFFEAKWYKSALAQYQTFKTRYPKSLRIEEAEFGIMDAYFRSGQYEQGMTTLEQIITTYTTSEPEFAARALYITGSKHWNADRNSQAKKIMQQLIKDYPRTSWADNACYVVGRIFQGEKAYKDAAAWYKKLYADYPGSSFVEESLWRAGWSSYLAQQYQEAAQTFSYVLAAFPDSSYVDDSLYWLGRTQEKQKQLQDAQHKYQQLVRISPDTYYAILAGERLRALHVPMQAPSQVKKTEPDMSYVLATIQQLLPPENYAQIQPHLNKVFELRNVGLRRYAGKEVDWIVSLIGDGSDIFDTKETRDNRLLFRYFFGRLYVAAGHYLPAIQWTSKLESVLKDDENRLFTYRLDTFPYPRDSIKYPLGYWELISTYSAANDLDPFLVAAIIRQESAYDPEALSYADARGLMQVIPDTGKRVAKELNVKDFTISQLYDPELNIRFGTVYLAGLLEDYEGNLYRALAAYNAGPKATTKWWPETGVVEQQVIVENISYTATRNYVKRVLRDQHQYRTLYAHLIK